MENKEKLWALTVHMTQNWDPLLEKAPFTFTDDVWNEVLEAAVDTGINTVIFDLLDGIEYGSHPEIAVPGAWSRKRMRDEIKRLKNLGITAIPRLNFSAAHCLWLGEYMKMISSKIYYSVCRDLILEAAELFGNPPYMSIVMDEEDADHIVKDRINIIRDGKAMWHDLRFLFDCVHETGAKPIISHDLLFGHTEEFIQNVSNDEVVIMPWYYSAFKPKHYMPITARDTLVEYYSKDKYKGMNIQYLEDDPWNVNFRNKVLPCAQYGYQYLPTVSFVNHQAYCFEDSINFYKENLPQEQLEGFVVSVFLTMTPEHKEQFLKNLELMKEAKKLYYK